MSPLNIAMLFFLVAGLLSPAPLQSEDAVFDWLQKELIADGFDAQFIRDLYQHHLLRFEARAIAGNLKREEKSLNYEQFLSPYAVRKARRYLERHQGALESAERDSGVPPSVVVAILMVETALGTYTGEYMTINVLSSMAAAMEPAVRARALASLDLDNYESRSRQRLLRRLSRRAARSYRELKAFIAYVHEDGLDPFQVRGSSEGAIGIPQFLPSNIHRYGKDGNGDGRVDLFEHEDAIASVASFLRAHRWQRDQGIQEKKKVLLHYNHSRYYVDTVYRLAQRLEQDN